jgi:hypothetical protein
MRHAGDEKENNGNPHAKPLSRQGQQRPLLLYPREQLSVLCGFA